MQIRMLQRLPFLAPLYLLMLLGTQVGCQASGMHQHAGFGRVTQRVGPCELRDWPCRAPSCVSNVATAYRLARRVGEAVPQRAAAGRGPPEEVGRYASADQDAWGSQRGLLLRATVEMTVGVVSGSLTCATLQAQIGLCCRNDGGVHRRLHKAAKQGHITKAWHGITERCPPCTATVSQPMV